MTLNPFVVFYKLRESAVKNIKAEGVLEALRDRKVITIDEHCELERWAIRQGMAMGSKKLERCQAAEADIRAMQLDIKVREDLKDILERKEF